jgi:pimeloyl-ACP methyl ester carboxylesterase
MSPTIETHTLDVPGVRLTYDVRGDLHSGETVLLMIGSPMGANGFTTLATYFTERPVVTYDPRGVERSVRTDDATESTPADHADDLHRLIEALDAGPVDVFASSGGAVNALALLERHPEQVGTLVAHEPPLSDLLPDREVLAAVAHDIHETYLSRGTGPAMAKFIQLVMFEGRLPDDYLDRPEPDPAVFGLPTEDDGDRSDPLLGQNMGTSTTYAPDFDSIIAAPTRVVVAAGVESANQMTGRAAAVVADRLGGELTVFPSNHGGFLGGEYGQSGDPDAFGPKLREVLRH